MTSVTVYTYTHSVTYVADNILKSLKDIIRLSGLDPTAFVNSWCSTQLALKTWMDSGHLEKVTLEIYDPNTNKLVSRWDLDISYSWNGGDGSFWTDTDQIRYSIKKAGLQPSYVKYKILMKTSPNEPHVEGWGVGSYRSTDGMLRQSLGSTVEHQGLSANAAYWRRS